MMMMMMMMMMNCFCGMVDRRKAFSLISSRDHCQRSSPLPISDTPQAGFQPVQNLSSDLVEWSCAVVLTTTPQHHWSGGQTEPPLSLFKVYWKWKSANISFYKLTSLVSGNVKSTKLRQKLTFSERLEELQWNF